MMRQRSFPLTDGLLMKAVKLLPWILGLLLLTATPVLAGEADLKIPDLHVVKFNLFGQEINGWTLLFSGSFVIAGTLGISLYLRSQIAKLPAHESMLKVADVIFQTCKTYLFQQGKFLLMLFGIISVAMTYYFMGLQEDRKSVV